MATDPGQTHPTADSRPPDHTPAQNNKDSRTPPSPRPRILIIDDQRAVRLGLSRLLSGCEARPLVQEAASAEEALALFTQHAPDVVVLDVDLDGTDGLALLPLMAVRASVLVLTSHTDAQTRVRAASLGASALVGKGDPSASLTREVAKLLTRRSARSTTGNAHSREEQPPR